MKLWSLAPLALALIAACNKAPNRPLFGLKKPGGSAIPQSPGPGTTPPVGSGVMQGKPADEYAANLKCSENETHRGLRSWRRLSNIEIRNTIIDVFKIPNPDISRFPTDIPKKEVFDTMNVEANFLSSSRFLAYETFSKDIAGKIDLKVLFPCLSNGESCIRMQLPSLLTAAWRRPAGMDEIDRLAKLFAGMSMDGLDAETAARGLLQAIVLSHHFLYRSELGTMQADNSFVLTDWELASALSYTLWRRPPNAELVKLASAGELSKAGAIRAQAEKMMNAPEAKEAWKDFGAQWLDARKIEDASKKNAMDFTPDIKAKMFAESRDFVSTIMFDSPDNTFKALLTADTSPADAALDPFYGAKSAAGKIQYVQPERSGLLGQTAFLASHATGEMANPITRGAFIAERLLCLQFLGAPPTKPPEKVPGMSSKNIFRSLTQGAICSSCHTTIDDLGFALENFDYLGRYRTTDEGEAIVTTGKMTLDGKMVTFSKPQEMAALIAASHQGQQCFVREAFRYGFGRVEFNWRHVAGRDVQPMVSAQGELDRCQIEAATDAMKAKGGDLKTAIIEMVSSPAFRIRLKGKPEKIQ